MEIEFSGYPKFRNIAVQDMSQPGEARREASLLAQELSFDDVKRGELELIVTELARNIALHGNGGQLILAAWRSGGRNSIDIMAVDKGQGIANLSAALEDGFSSAGTPGTGMGAVSRMANNFEVFSQPRAGTAVLARIDNKKKLASPLCLGAVSVPITGEKICGDAFATAHTSSRSVFMVVDGLGHGPIAAEASAVAVETFQKFLGDPPAEIIERMHDALKATRGAAAAVAEIRHDEGTIVYCGVGNIIGLVASPDHDPVRSMVSNNGIVGHQMARVAEFNYPWPAKATLVMHSDGLNSHWNFKSYPGLLNKDPALIAAVVYRDNYRVRDDATILVAGRNLLKVA